MPTDEAGGTIETGTFYETAHVDYEAASASTKTLHGIMVIDAAAMTVRVDEGRVGQEKPTLATFATSGTSWTLTAGCGANGSGSLGYTYAAGTLKVYNAQGKNVTTWTKQ